MDLMTRVRTQWDRLLATSCAVLGLILLFVGWRGVSGTAYPAEQLPYLISAGLGGLFCLGVSAVLRLSADLHDEWRKLDRIERALLDAAMHDRATDDRATDDRATKGEASDETRVLSAATSQAP